MVLKKNLIFKFLFNFEKKLSHLKNSQILINGFKFWKKMVKFSINFFKIQ
jgi:hypothetical protein